MMNMKSNQNKWNWVSTVTWLTISGIMVYMVILVFI